MMNAESNQLKEILPLYQRVMEAIGDEMGAFLKPEFFCLDVTDEFDLDAHEFPFRVKTTSHHQASEWLGIKDSALSLEEQFYKRLEAIKEANGLELHFSDEVWGVACKDAAEFKKGLELLAKDLGVDKPSRGARQ